MVFPPGWLLCRIAGLRDQRGLKDSLGTSAQILVGVHSRVQCVNKDMRNAGLLSPRSLLPAYTPSLAVPYRLPLNKNLKWVCSVESYESFQVCKPVKSLQKVTSARWKIMQEEGQGVAEERLHPNERPHWEGDKRAKILKGREWTLYITGGNHSN